MDAYEQQMTDIHIVEEPREKRGSVFYINGIEYVETSTSKKEAPSKSTYGKERKQKEEQAKKNQQKTATEMRKAAILTLHSIRGM